MSRKRAIRFRGFSRHAKKWVFGLLTKQGAKTSFITDDKGAIWPCYSSSIGQHIGACAMGEGVGWHWSAILEQGGVRIVPDSDESHAFGYMKENGISSMHPTNNGPELYEGDIVSAKFTNGKRDSKGRLYTERINCLIVYDHAKLQWRLQRLQAGRGYGNYYGSALGWNVKLVGNATEHPHLLNDEASKGKHVGSMNELGHLVGKVA